MNAPDPLFELFATTAADVRAPLARLADELRSQGRWHELLEVRLSQARLAHGLSVDAGSADAMTPEVRAALEADYVAACEEVGRGLIAAEQWRDAWFYLNTAGRPEPLREALVDVEPTDETADVLIEVALHEGAAPAVGYQWLIERYGTCNAVTTLEGLGPHLPIADLAACARVLAHHLHTELLSNLRAHIERHEGQPSADGDLPEMLSNRPWLFEHEAAHVDASHLSAAVRMARVLEKPGDLLVAWRLADYGARLHKSLHYSDAPPFADTYHAHRLFYAAQRGQQVDEAIAYFRKQAEQANPEVDGLAPLETLLVLLQRVGRGGEALQDFGRLTPREARLSPYAPRPLDLARASGDWAAYEEAMRQRGDVVGFAQGRAAQAEASRGRESTVESLKPPTGD